MAATANPYDGAGQAALAQECLAAGDYAGARVAALMAFELGDGSPAQHAVTLARCSMRLGDDRLGREWLVRAVELGLRDLEPLRVDDDFALLREESEIWQLLGILDNPDCARDEGWRFDLAFFAQELRRRAVAPFALISEEEFDGAVAWLDGQIPTLSDAAILLELNRLLIPLRDGHAYIAPAIDRPDLSITLPLEMYLFAEGLFVVSASPEYADLVGHAVVAIDGQSIEQVIERVNATICRDNEQWPMEIAPFRLRETAFLHALGVLNAPDCAVLTVRDETGMRRERSVVANDAFPAAPLGRNYPFPQDWVSLLDAFPNRPRYLRDLRTPFWYEPIPELDAMYLQINAVRDAVDETMLEFTARFFSELDRLSPARLILDIRLNKGGNTTLEWPFLHRLIGHPLNRDGSLFVIIGRRTWSAAQNFATYLDVHTEAIFVGEPTGSSPTFIGESVEFTLPWSGTRVNISDLLWQSGWPEDRRPWIAPNLPAAPTFEAFGAGRDLALEAIAVELERVATDA